MTDLKDGRYSISYIPTSSGEFNLSIKLSGNSIMGSSFKLKVTPGNKYLSVKPGGLNQCKNNNRHFPNNSNSDTSSKKGNSILHAFNPSTPRVNYGNMKCSFNFWFCWRNPMVWPFKLIFFWKYYSKVPFVFQNFAKRNLGFFLNFDIWHSWNKHVITREWTFSYLT